MKLKQPSVENVTVLSAIMDYKSLERLEVNERLASVAHRLSIFEDNGTTSAMVEDGLDDISDSDNKSDDEVMGNETITDWLNDLDEVDRTKYEALKAEWTQDRDHLKINVFKIQIKLGQGWNNKRNPMATNLETKLFATRMKEAKKWRDKYVQSKPTGYTLSAGEKKTILGQIKFL
jgi:hypothetical protein